MPLTFPSFPLGTPKRGHTYAYIKQLVNRSSILATDRNTGVDASDQNAQIVINFPCMPDTIELVRQVNYKNLLHSPVIPDGYHLYDYTSPLTIPISFSIHAYDDEYCGINGPLVLISLAAKLHALGMPIVPNSAQRTDSSLAGAPPISNIPNGDIDAQAAQAADSNSIKTENFNNSTYIANGQRMLIPTFNRFAGPPACVLSLMMAQLGSSSSNANASNDGLRSLGIYCTGFLMNDLRVTFKGPWLQGNFDQAGLVNLPSEAEYSFTFVHQPGYTNNIMDGASPIVATNASQILQRLYNTADLSGDVRYVAIDGSGIPDVKAPTGN